MRAYRAADRNNDGFIVRKEFRRLLKYIVYFNDLWDKFDAIDKVRFSLRQDRTQPRRLADAATCQDHDHRLDVEEFVRGCGLVGLQISREEAVREFGAMDGNHGPLLQCTVVLAGI